MALFGKKKKEDSPDLDADLFPSEPPALPNPLADQVAQLRQQGYADDQIVQYLQQQGHAPDEINSAMQQAMPNAGPLPEQQLEVNAPPGSTVEVQSSPPPMSSPQPPMPPPFQPGQEMQQGSGEMPDKERIEEVAEAIIDEKWNKLIQDINKVIEWKEKADARLVTMEQEIKDVKGSFDALHKGVLGKITEYDQNLSNVGVEIKAMEKVFQKVLPTFTENVNKLERLTKGVGKKK
jgi:hypothetical protein